MVKEIIHLLHTADILNLVLSTSFLIYYIVLIIIYKKFKGDKKLWNLLCFIPLVISIIHLIIFVFGSAFLEILPNYLTIYVPAILISLMPLLTKKKITYNIGKIVTIILCIIASLIAVDSLKITNYTRKSLSKAYIALCDKFEKEYILKDWKKIDYKKLKEEGLVLVKEAEKTDYVSKKRPPRRSFSPELREPADEFSAGLSGKRTCSTGSESSNNGIFYLIFPESAIKHGWFR